MSMVQWWNDTGGKIEVMEEKYYIVLVVDE